MLVHARVPSITDFASFPCRIVSQAAAPQSRFHRDQSTDSQAQTRMMACLGIRVIELFRRNVTRGVRFANLEGNMS